MIEILNFIFTDFWHFAGSVIILAVFENVIGNIIKGFIHIFKKSQ